MRVGAQIRVNNRVGSEGESASVRIRVIGLSPREAKPLTGTPFTHTHTHTHARTRTCTP